MPSKPSVVITGSSRGIGLGLARAFLERGCQVLISGTQEETLARTHADLAHTFGEDRVFSTLCDVRKMADNEGLWKKGLDTFGKIDIWINNAGIAPAVLTLDQLDEEVIRNVVDINLKGLLLGCKTALSGFKDQGYGQLYNMEGFGSDGRIMFGMSTYGSTKAAVSYLTRSLSREVRGTNISVCSLSPGMVVTDLLMSNVDTKGPDYPRQKKIFNILADHVDTVAPWLVEKIIRSPKNGQRINWLTTAKILKRFLLSPIVKRNIL